MLDFEPIRSIPYARATLITLADLVVVFALLRLAGLSGGALARLSGVFEPIGRATVFGVLALGPAIAACVLLAPLAKSVTVPDLAWKTFVGPFFEELVFRGLAVGVLVRLCGWPVVAACVWPAAFFGAAHAWQGGDWQEVAGIVGITAAGGLLFGWLYVRWGFNLWPAIMIHAGLNGLWLLFDLGENAIGGWFGNGLRFSVVALAILVTIWLTGKRHADAPHS
jgi:membrane protease YdiL (CAAX protease family)